jgi:Heterokaryon incompatibility protein (HET)
MGLYNDLPLLPTEQTIRLMNLRPASDRDAPLIAELFIVSLDTNPQYACLSYCWGPPTIMCPVTCNNVMLPIRENLALALGSIRSMSSLPLWVDQICINQDDISERSAQVSCMKRIYIQASKTFVYIGEPDSDATEDACEVLEQLTIPWLSTMNWEDGDLNRKIPPLRAQIAAGKLAMQHPRLMKRSYNKDVTRALSQLLERPYFSRKWIIQELVMSRSLHCVLGLHCFEWYKFILLALKETKCLFNTELTNATQVFWLFQLCRNFIDQRPCSLLELLYHSRFFKAMDPRDHVFALLGAASDSDDFPKPDYGIAVEQLYHKISSCLIRQGRGFLVLHLTGIRHRDNGLPSWVVDWRHLDAFYPCKHFASFEAGGSHGHIQLIPDITTIRVSGKLMDRVAAIGGLFNAEMNIWDRLAQYIDDCTRAFEQFYEDGTGRLAIQKDLASLIFFDMKYDDGNPDRMMFVFNEEYYDDVRGQDTTSLDSATWTQFAVMRCRFLVDQLGDRLSRAGHRIGIGGLSKLGQKLRPTETPMTLVEHHIIKGLVNTSIVENCLRYNFFRPTTRPIMTQKRLLGLAPALTEKGDVVCVIHGAKAPFILRPAGDGTYKIVGEAYVGDIMFGETLSDDSCPVQEILIS